MVRNEFERGENSPRGILSKRIEAAAYEWHNYGKSTIGNRSDIERVPIENLQAFYKKYYQPDNVVLVVAGKFEEAKALALVREILRRHPAADAQARRNLHRGAAAGRRAAVTLRRVGDVGVVGVAYHIPAGPHEGLAGAASAGQYPEHATLGPSVQGIGGNQEGHQRLRLRPGRA